VDVASAEETLKVTKYGQLARKDKANIIVNTRQIYFIHKLLKDNESHIVAKDGEDNLSIILQELGDPKQFVEADVQIQLENKFPPKQDKAQEKSDQKEETINSAIKVLRKIPGFSGDTFLEIFVRMKLHCKKMGNDELAEEVNQVIASLQNLVKYGLVSPKDGFNSFLKDIALEVQARQSRRQEQLKELQRLKIAIAETDDQLKALELHQKDLANYLKSLRQTSTSNFRVQTKKFKYKELYKAKVISDSEIAPPQQSKVVFEIKHTEPEKFEISGKIKNIPGFSRSFTLELQDLLKCKEENQITFDTEKGIELYVSSTLVFLNKQFFHTRK